LPNTLQPPRAEEAFVGSECHSSLLKPSRSSSRVGEDEGPKMIGIRSLSSVAVLLFTRLAEAQLPLSLMRGLLDDVTGFASCYGQFALTL
jgi:hypothetical protein